MVKFDRNTQYLGEIEKFCFADPDTYWITFSSGKLYWCQAETPVTEHRSPEGYVAKVRKAKNGWSCTDRNKQPLIFERLSGALLKTQGYRGTICRLSEKMEDYVLTKIDGRKLPYTIRAEEQFNQMTAVLEDLIKELTWQDFELFVDLIFSKSGWVRTYQLGGTVKDFDLALEHPVTREKALVQVKGKADASVYIDYCKRLASYSEYEKQYFAVHTFVGDISKIEETKLQFLGPRELAVHALNTGLTNWLILKTS